MTAIFEAYNFSVDQLPMFYQRINQVIEYPNGKTTSLGIIYWGEEKHQNGIEDAIPRLTEHGKENFYDVYTAVRTPARARKFSEQTGISKAILRILKHDIELWLPKAVSLNEFELFQTKPDYLIAMNQIGLEDQLAVVSSCQTPSQREGISLRLALDNSTMQEIIKLCDYYRTGKTLDHIRPKLYYEMGIDSLEKWASQTPDGIIARFAEYIEAKGLADKRLIPFSKEVMNGIEWAKMHLEVYAVQW